MLLVPALWFHLSIELRAERIQQRSHARTRGSRTGTDVRRLSILLAYAVGVIPATLMDARVPRFCEDDCGHDEDWRPIMAGERRDHRGASADPAWTPLSAMASALVTEVGGILSHGAIVARKYGIPAVMGVRGITAALSTGQVVQVDGNRGRVQLIT